MSITVHAIVLGAVLITSVLASGVLPEPRAVLTLTLQRVVQPVDIDLPLPARPRTTTSSSSASPPRVQLPADVAPVEPPIGIAPETDRQAIASGTINSVAAIESRSGSLVDGVGIAERPPAVPPALSPEPQRLHQGIQAPRKTVDVAPKYPMLARESRIEGIVILDVIIDEHGTVTSTRVLRSVPLLDQAAIDAVQAWKFSPARLNGEAIPIVMTVTVSFRLQ